MAGVPVSVPLRWNAPLPRERYLKVDVDVCCRSRSGCSSIVPGVGCCWYTEFPLRVAELRARCRLDTDRGTSAADWEAPGAADEPDERANFGVWGGSSNGNGTSRYARKLPTLDSLD